MPVWSLVGPWEKLSYRLAADNCVVDGFRELPAPQTAAAIARAFLNLMVSGGGPLVRSGPTGVDHAFRKIIAGRGAGRQYDARDARRAMGLAAHFRPRRQVHQRCCGDAATGKIHAAQRALIVGAGRGDAAQANDFSTDAQRRGINNLDGARNGSGQGRGNNQVT